MKNAIKLTDENLVLSYGVEDSNALSVKNPKMICQLLDIVGYLLFYSGCSYIP